MSACNVGDPGSIPGSGRSPGEGNGKPLQYSCIENPMNSMKRQKDRTLKDELPRSVGTQYATGDIRLENNSSVQFSSLVAQRLKCLPAMQETWVQSLGQEDPLEKEMATHSSILTWRIPRTEEPGRLQSMGSQESDATYRQNHHHHTY